MSSGPLHDEHAVPGDLDRLRQITDSLNRSFTPAEMATFAMMLVETAPDGIVVADSSGVVVLVNTQAELLFGFHRSEMIGEHVEKFMPERFREGHLAHRSLYLEEPRARAMGANLALFVLRKDGKEVQVEISLAPMVTTRGTFIITFIRRRREPRG